MVEKFSHLISGEGRPGLKYLKLGGEAWMQRCLGIMSGHLVSAAEKKGSIELSNVNGRVKTGLGKAKQHAVT